MQKLREVIDDNFVNFQKRYDRVSDIISKLQNEMNHTNAVFEVVEKHINEMNYSVNSRNDDDASFDHFRQSSSILYDTFEEEMKEDEIMQF